MVRRLVRIVCVVAIVSGFASVTQAAPMTHVADSIARHQHPERGFFQASHQHQHQTQTRTIPFVRLLSRR
jgi:hypothetical protein